MLGELRGRGSAARASSASTRCARVWSALPTRRTPSDGHRRLGAHQLALCAVAGRRRPRVFDVPVTKRVIELGALDRDFIADTRRASSLVAELDATPWDALLAAAGVPPRTVDEIAQLYAPEPTTIACWGMGITNTATRWRPSDDRQPAAASRPDQQTSAGVCPVRGHSNVQVTAPWAFGRRRRGFLDRLGAEFGFEPRVPVWARHRHHRGHAGWQVKVFIAMGGNFTTATDLAATWRGLQQCALTVHVAASSTAATSSHGRRRWCCPASAAPRSTLQNTGTTKRHRRRLDEHGASVRRHERPASEHLLSSP